jgi:hypothetical protein
MNLLRKDTFAVWQLNSQSIQDSMLNKYRCAEHFRVDIPAACALPTVTKGNFYKSYSSKSSYNNAGS